MCGPRLCTSTMSNPPRLQDSTCKRHVLADSGINPIHRRTIAVERFAVLNFRRSLPNARLQPGGLDIVLRRLFLAGGGSIWLGPPSEAIFNPDARSHKVFRPPFSCPPYQTGDHVDDGDNRTLSVPSQLG